MKRVFYVFSFLLPQESETVFLCSKSKPSWKINNRQLSIPVQPRKKVGMHLGDTPSLPEDLPMGEMPLRCRLPH